MLPAQVRSCRPAGAGWEAVIETAGATATVRLPDRPGDGAGPLVITLLDPPLFGPDGSLIPARVPR